MEDLPALSLPELLAALWDRRGEPPETRLPAGRLRPPPAAA
jgi:hypothetical protein